MDSSEQKKTKKNLKKFLTRRPTLQAVREKGYIKGMCTRSGIYIMLAESSVVCEAKMSTSKVFIVIRLQLCR